MTSAAWIMLGVTWSVILFFAGKFFLMVLKTPTRSDSDSHDDPPRKDA